MADGQAVLKKIEIESEIMDGTQQGKYMFPMQFVFVLS